MGPFFGGLEILSFKDSMFQQLPIGEARGSTCYAKSQAELLWNENWKTQIVFFVEPGVQKLADMILGVRFRISCEPFALRNFQCLSFSRSALLPAIACNAAMWTQYIYWIEWYFRQYSWSNCSMSPYKDSPFISLLVTQFWQAAMPCMTIILHRDLWESFLQAKKPCE